jgi:hypothetical protein
VVTQTGDGMVPLTTGGGRVIPVGVGVGVGVLVLVKVHGQSVMVKVCEAVAVYVLVPPTKVVAAGQ